jgi:predicted nucleotidyltransferase
MKISGIICEYNPFHNGHKYHIEQTRTRFGADHVVCVMSGHFTQRGDAAIYDKWQRTNIALQNGADLILELPVSYALGSAEQFTFGAVRILEALGCVDMLSFGSECGDISLLEETAGAVEYALQHEAFFGKMRRGMAFPAALQATVEEFYETDVSEVLSAPNNTLAIEYLRALSEIGSRIKPVTVKRTAEHDGGDSAVSDGVSFASASKLRRNILADNVEKTEIDAFLPKQNHDNPAMLSRLDTALLAKLRTMTAAEIREAPNVLHGLENRIYKAVRFARSVDELLILIKTKRYPLARLRRILLCCLLGITKKDVKTPPAYIRVLGMNDKGKEILSAAAKNCPLPMDTSLLKLSKTGENQRRQAHLEETAGNLYALAQEKVRQCGLDYSMPAVIIK